MNTATAEFLEGATVYTRDDEKVGSVSEVWTDADGRPTHVEVTSGWFGTDKHIIPLSKLARRGDEYVAMQSKKELEEAPRYRGEDLLDYGREREIGEHYGEYVREWDAEHDHDLTEGPTPETREAMHDDDHRSRRRLRRRAERT
ncbi:MAG: PRC-barrel domain-containing protein [Thermoleophilia bacterium]